MKTWKWIKLFCPKCGKEKIPGIGALDKPDSMISIYPCWECEHPEIAEAEHRAWEESERKIDEMVTRGEILDCNGKPVPLIRMRQ